MNPKLQSRDACSPLGNTTRHSKAFLLVILQLSKTKWTFQFGCFPLVMSKAAIRVCSDWVPVTGAGVSALRQRWRESPIGESRCHRVEDQDYVVIGFRDVIHPRRHTQVA